MDFLFQLEEIRDDIHEIVFGHVDDQILGHEGFGAFFAIFDVFFIDFRVLAVAVAQRDRRRCFLDDETGQYNPSLVSIDQLMY